jgi:hypothetical protein
VPVAVVPVMRVVGSRVIVAGLGIVVVAVDAGVGTSVIHVACGMKLESERFQSCDPPRRLTTLSRYHIDGSGPRCIFDGHVRASIHFAGNLVAFKQTDPGRDNLHSLLPRPVHKERGCFYGDEEWLIHN